MEPDLEISKKMLGGLIYLGLDLGIYKKMVMDSIHRCLYVYPHQKNISNSLEYATDNILPRGFGPHWVLEVLEERLERERSLKHEH